MNIHSLEEDLSEGRPHVSYIIMLPSGMQHILWRIEPGNLGFSPKFPTSSFPRPLSDWVCSALISLPVPSEEDKGKRWGPALSEQTVKVTWMPQKFCSLDNNRDICLTSEQVTSHLACFELLEQFVSTQSCLLSSFWTVFNRILFRSRSLKSDIVPRNYSMCCTVEVCFMQILFQRWGDGFEKYLSVASKSHILPGLWDKFIIIKCFGKCSPFSFLNVTPEKNLKMAKFLNIDFFGQRSQENKLQWIKNLPIG